MAAIQATKWQAQLNDATKFYGGSVGDPGCVNVSAIPIDLMRTFAVSHNTFSHTYYVPFKRWYKDGKVWPDYVYPTQYALQDGSTLTVDYDPATGYLKLTQV